MSPGGDLDHLGTLLFLGDLESVQAEFAARVKRLSASGLFPVSSDDPHAAAAAELYALRYGPTRTPIYNVLLLGSVIQPYLRQQHLAVARWLAQTAKVPVDGTDLSGTTALGHALSTKPSFDSAFAQILYDAGGDVTVRNRYGGTCAHDLAQIWDMHDRATVRKAQGALEWWLAHGGNVDIMDNDGYTVRAGITVGERRGLTALGDVMRGEDERRRKMSARVCAFCGREPEGEVKLLTCSRCKKTRYCAPPRSCQKNDWRKHKGTCKA